MVSKIARFLRKVINCICFIKFKRRVFVSPHQNCFNDKYDIVNFSGSNSLCVVNYLLEHYSNHKKLIVYVENYDESRLGIVKEYIGQICNPCIKVVFVKSHLFVKKRMQRLLLRLRNDLIRYSCRTWISDTPYRDFADKNFLQTTICLNYCTPLKSVPLFNGRKFKFIDKYFSTSSIAGMIHCAEFKIPLRNLIVSGFPRTDYLRKNNKFETIKKWIASKTNVDYEHIFFYAPTYRDYDGAFRDTNVFGYKNSESILNDFLEKNKILVVSKMHPLQDKSCIAFSNRIIEYESNYNFSLYDFLAYSDILISDCSSIIHEFIVTGRPIVVNFFDIEKYISTRGFAFDPIDLALPSKICKTENDLIHQLDLVLHSSSKIIDDKYFFVQKTFQKYVNLDATERVSNYVVDIIHGKTK